ncbi:CHAP domain-containing protein [Pseudorhodoferax sp. Leaf274]|uniref:CHAP domain-containing protein n=1 Tax=Pseudorhodoferax sp. Leaf274 TaxID=1736318 RepID=UPI0007037C6C|nr:CHAP domain-containing protein [Pseudorhodoferax sp. Leaf274]KQP45066.1 hypothetical protein ASF44_26660 [Pseudorhodoferax sp. Leaf274]
MTDAAQLIARARSMLRRKTLYWAGSGGVDPRAPDCTTPLEVGRQWPGLPASQRAELAPLAQAAGLDLNDPTLVLPACDCSGFVCWALGIPRRTAAGEWINTDSIWADAKGAQRGFLLRAQAAAGDLVVYPKPADAKYGHVGIVTEVDGAGRATRVLHCSALNFALAPAGDAIRETAPAVFAQQAASVYCQPKTSLAAMVSGRM